MTDTVGLREYIDQRIETLSREMLIRHDAQRTAIDAAITAADRAVSKAEAATEKRFEGVNEFRNTLADQQKTFVTQSTFDARIDAILGRIVSIEKQMNSLVSERQGIVGGWGYAVGVVGLVLAIGAAIVTTLRK